jgi:hypothetical protein
MMGGQRLLQGSVQQCSHHNIHGGLSTYLIHEVCGMDMCRYWLGADHGYEKEKKRKMPTAPGIPRRSPIQVLTGPNVA